LTTFLVDLFAIPAVGSLLFPSVSIASRFIGGKVCTADADFVSGRKIWLDLKDL
jgi:hypothetical protein